MEKRLQTILAHAGVASRRRAVQLIESGKVTVDGRPVTGKGSRFDPGKHKIRVNGKLIAGEKKYYFLFNKPRDVISTVSDTHGRKKVADFFKNIKARLYPVGRLDRDTSGILIVTNDGDLTHRLSHPSFEVEKEYVVKVTPGISRDYIRRLERGIKIEGKFTAPCEIKLLESDDESGTYEIVLHEGRKRQIRMMFKEAGGRVVELKRVKYAGFTLDRLKEGQYRELTEEEVEKLKLI